uniref:Pyruvate dehydrogenase E1 component subunit alpha n=1 Tax=Pycnococcus provasolii TaxID=41880 RepID=A0A7S2AH52_9CHLO|mmetsp:Transcript_11098/g.25131  ORF Transcript_11098/g.25131 Transcript_11098/m.25131 type:complete len:422 (+) Transcript_11098:19-1284(+)
MSSAMASSSWSLMRLGASRLSSMMGLARVVSSSSMSNSSSSMMSSSFSSSSAASLVTTSLGDAPITIELPRPYDTHLCEPPSTTVTTTPAEIEKFFKTTYLMRRMEIACDVLYKGKFIRGFCHLYDGQEAIIVGIEAALTWNDSIVTSYRDHCTHLGRGGNVKEVIAELLGKAPGCSKGNGGSMHMYRKETNFYGGNGIVGAQVPLGAGLAFGHKYRNDGCVAITMYGDGAANQGQIFEAMNMAALWDLPCIFVCENNHYGMGTAEWRSAKSPEYYKRGDYIPGIKIDGMDCLSVKQGFAFAKEFALKNGPIIVEADTYRYHGHSMSDPGSTYRTRDEISGVRQERDPVDRMRKLLIDVVGTSPDQIKAWEKDLRKEVDDAVEFAKNAPLPPDAQLYENIYVDGKGIEARGVEISNVNMLG